MIAERTSMDLQDGMLENIEPVSSVSDYINRVQLLEKNWCDEKNSFLVFRGEAEEYSTPCIPTIYRDYSLNQIENYEINMFCAMRQNNISGNADYLHNAIDAQHDGFPSRLLDVSYNCLIALYFATTPYYVYPEDSLDNSDGLVYAFKYNEALSPEAQNTKEIYNAALEGNKNILNDAFFSYNHRLIDHCKQNKRIIAQQGAFILFTGDIPEPIPFHQLYGIRISKQGKAQIRRELQTLFGIYTGSVYPEVELMRDEIKRKCLRMNTIGVGLQSNTDATLEIYRSEYEYFADCLDYYVNNGKETGDLSRIIEKSVVNQKDRLLAYLARLQDIISTEELDSQIKNDANKAINIAKLKYSSIINNFIKDIPVDLGLKIDKSSELEYEEKKSE